MSGEGGRVSGAVLVVEDDRELRELVRRYLERAGHPVQTTGSGAEALAAMAAGGIELVVLDLGLPDVDGLEVLAAARDAGRSRWWCSPLAATSRTASMVVAGLPGVRPCSIARFCGGPGNGGGPSTDRWSTCGSSGWW